MNTNNEAILSSIEIEPVRPANKSMIWLHGLGADGNDSVPFASELKLPSQINMRFIFPHAPVMPVTINSGYAMPAWYDIYGIDINAKIDETGIANSIAQIEKLIDREVKRGIATQNIFPAGFSQGAAVALTTGLFYSQPLAGIIALSGYLPLPNALREKASAVNKQIPIFQAHGTQDFVVPFAIGKATHSVLEQAGYPVTWHTYPMPHSVCIEEVNDITEWLKRVC